MTCPRVQQNLKAYLDGELGRVARAGVRAHVLRCEACRTEAAALRAVCDSVKLLRPPVSPAGIRARAHEAARSMRPDPHVSPRSRRRWLLPAFSAAILLAVAIWLLLPAATDAQAAFAAVTAAVDGVDTFHMVGWTELPGQHRTTSETWYAAGKWRMEESSGEMQVFDGERLHIYLPQQNTLFLNVSDQPFGTPFTGFKAQALLRGEASDAEITVQRARYQGRSVDRFERTREGLDEKLVIFADRDTALPLAVQVYGRLSGAWQLLGGTETVEYNISLDPDLFVLSPPAGAVLVDKEEWVTAWQTRYDEGMARAVINGDEAVLRDFQVTTTGDVFAIWSPGRPVGVPGPYAKLTDSLGTLYLRPQEGFQAGHDPCAWFIPLVPPSSTPAWYELTVGIAPRLPSQHEQRVTFRVAEPVLSPIPSPIYPTPRPRPGAPAFRGPDASDAEATRAETRAAYQSEEGARE